MHDQAATVGGATAATAHRAAISRAAFVAWLGQLTGQQRTAVIAELLVADGLAAVPEPYQDAALLFAPQAGRIASDARLASQATPLLPPLVETPDGAVYYTSGGPTYRKVPDNATFTSLGLNPAAVVRVAELEQKTGKPWPHAATPETAFVDAAKLVAAAGDVADAYRLALFARARLG